MAGIRLIVSLPLLLLANGARISTRAQLDARSSSDTQVGPEDDPWQVGKKYACMRKWEDYRSKYTDSYCLANLLEAKSIATEHQEFATDIKKCEGSLAGTWKMKLCALKGGAPEGRISYSTKTLVPKSCFRVSSVEAKYAVIEAAVNEDACTELEQAAEDQDILPMITTTTTTTTSTITTTTTTIEEEVILSENVSTDDVERMEAKHLFTAGNDFLWEYHGKAMKCCVSTAGKPVELQDLHAEELPAARSIGKKTGCGYMFGDTYHNGLRSYRGSEPTCPLPVEDLMAISFEAKALFTKESTLWEYNGQAIKCCVSSSGKPTMLVDLHAEVLPSARSYGTKTGCGRMFGDTYHNGLKGYKEADPTCPVSVAALLPIVGADYPTIATSLE